MIISSQLQPATASYRKVVAAGDYWIYVVKTDQTLRILDLEGNPVTKLTMPGSLTALTELHFALNHLTSFALPGGLTNLARLVPPPREHTDLLPITAFAPPCYKLSAL